MQKTSASVRLYRVKVAVVGSLATALLLVSCSSPQAEPSPSDPAIAEGAATETSSPISTPESTPTEIDQSSSLVPVGDPYYMPRAEPPTQIGDYQLLTPELVAAEGMTCDGSPIATSPGVTNVIYMTADAMNTARSRMGECRHMNGPVIGHPGAIFLAVIEATATGEPTDSPVCEEYFDYVACNMYFASGAALSAREPTAPDPAAQMDYISSFMMTYLANDNMFANTAGA